MKRLLLASLVSSLLVGCGGDGDNHIGGSFPLIPLEPSKPINPPAVEGGELPDIGVDYEEYPTTPCEEGMDCMDEGFTNPSLPMIPVDPPLVPPTTPCEEGMDCMDDGFTNPNLTDAEKRLKVIKEIAKISNYDESYIDSICQNGIYTEKSFDSGSVNTCRLIDGGFEVMTHSPFLNPDYATNIIHRPMHGEFEIPFVNMPDLYFEDPDHIEFRNVNNQSPVPPSIGELDFQVIDAHTINSNKSAGKILFKVSGEQLANYHSNDKLNNGNGFFVNIFGNRVEVKDGVEHSLENTFIHGAMLFKRGTQCEVQFSDFYKHCALRGVQK